MAEKDSTQKKKKNETGTRNADFQDKKIKKTKFIVCLTGMPGSGKSTVADSLKKKGFSVIAMGDVVRDEARRKNIEPTDINLGKLMLKLRREIGPGAIAQLILNEIEKREVRSDANQNIVIDGVRSVPEVEILRTIGLVKLLSIHASANTRFDHLKKRARGDAPLNENDFGIRDKRELAVGISEAIAMSDEMLSNNNLTVKELEEKAVGIVRKWVGEFYNDDGIRNNKGR
jgi:dephospho-CoA kinase